VVLFDPDGVREELPAVRRRAFLNAGTFGPLPRVADRAMREHMDLSLQRGRIGIDEWFGLMDEVRGALALTFGATAFAGLDPASAESEAD
jgi:hypothetical protein